MARVGALELATSLTGCSLACFVTAKYPDAVECALEHMVKGACGAGGLMFAGLGLFCGVQKLAMLLSTEEEIDHATTRDQRRKALTVQLAAACNILAGAYVWLRSGPASHASQKFAAITTVLHGCATSLLALAALVSERKFVFDLETFAHLSTPESVLGALLGVLFAGKGKATQGARFGHLLSCLLGFARLAWAREVCWDKALAVPGAVRVSVATADAIRKTSAARIFCLPPLSVEIAELASVTGRAVYAGTSLWAPFALPNYDSPYLCFAPNVCVPITAMQSLAIAQFIARLCR